MKRNRGKGKPYVARPLAWEKDGDCIRCTSHKGDERGYVSIYRNGKTSKVPRLILAKRGVKLDGRIASRHTCDHPWCINPAHIIPGTWADNSQDRRERGRSPNIRGEMNSSSKLSNSDVISIRGFLSCGITMRSLANRYNVTRQCIGNIKRRKTWTHI